MSERLFFIRTPLQALIAMQIQQGGSHRDTIVYVPVSESPKHRIYFERLSGADKVFVAYKPLPSWHAAELWHYFRIPARVKSRKFDEIYVSSFGSLEFGLLRRNSPGASVNTFDDGTFNIIHDVIAGYVNGESSRRKWLKRMLGVQDNPSLIQQVTRHYTIYPGQFAYFDRSKVVEVALSTMPCSGSQRAVLLLGSPTHFFNDDIQVEQARVRCSLPHDIYLPHPAERASAYVSPALRDSVLIRRACEDRIAEDVVSYLCELGFNPEVYGFGSTALANVAGAVASTNIVIPGLSDRRDEIFSCLGVRSVPSRCLPH